MNYLPENRVLSFDSLGMVVCCETSWGDMSKHLFTPVRGLKTEQSFHPSLDQQSNELIRISFRSMGDLKTTVSAKSSPLLVRMHESCILGAVTSSSLQEIPTGWYCFNNWDGPVDLAILRNFLSLLSFFWFPRLLSFFPPSRREYFNSCKIAIPPAPALLCLLCDKAP